MPTIYFNFITSFGDNGTIYLYESWLPFLSDDFYDISEIQKK